MTEMVLFHHAQGLTAGVVAFADRIRAAGHTVHTPDLYDGQTYETLEEGMSHVTSVGFDALVDTAVAIGGTFPSSVVYAGISLGVPAAERLAITRAGAGGALLFCACMAATEYDDGGWPASVPVQVHAKASDPEFDNGWDKPAAEALVAQADDGELFTYPGEQHLFLDSSLDSYDADATELALGRVLELLGRRAE